MPLILPATAKTKRLNPTSVEQWSKYAEALTPFALMGRWWIGDLFSAADRLGISDPVVDLINNDPAWQGSQIASDRALAEAFNGRRRRTRLSAEHHEAVMRDHQEVADLLLDTAEKHRLSVSELRQTAAELRRHHS